MRIRPATLLSALIFGSVVFSASASAVGLGFLAASIGQGTAEAVCRHHRPQGALIHATGGSGDLTELLQLAASHPLRTMA